MKRLMTALLATTILSTQARGQLATFDAANAVGQARSLLQELKGYALQGQQYITEGQQLIQVTNMLTAIAHNPNIGNIMALAQQTGLTADLPLDPYATMALISGVGGINSVNDIVGRLSLLGSVVHGSYDRDMLYSCQTDNYSCLTAQQRAASNAGYKGAVGTLFQDVSSHLNVLTAIREKLALSPNEKDTADLHAQVAVEQAWIANQQTQLTAVVALADAQQRVSAEQADQKVNHDFAVFRASHGG